MHKINLANKRKLIRLLLVVPLMFAFGYALVPLYRKICDVTGINFLTKKLHYTTNSDVDHSLEVDLSRSIKIEFDANSRGALHFIPQQASINVNPGQTVRVMYKVTNTKNQSIKAQAIPSYAPKQAASFFKKLECFCFSEQVFQPFEARQMPVIFSIDPKIPKNISVIMLSYTFFSIK